MKTYFVYKFGVRVNDKNGKPLIIKARGHNEAERKALKLFESHELRYIQVEYTEI